MRFGLLAALLALGSPALADPCGMVPPIYTGDGPPIVRIGIQKTYVSFKDGIESFVIRPGYRGKVAEFGMLIPFPSPPAIRKVADDVFAHVAAAADPPLVDPSYMFMEFEAMSADGAGGGGGGLGVNQVNVLREEAVGMYEVAVLEAGSAAALSRWIDDHGYSYPDGMDATCEDYVKQGWCFVAVKTRVGRKAAVQPKPGMRQADPTLPEGAGFDGHVQAMGFRFRTPKLVVPMRLSAFNAGELRNVIYVLAEEGLRADRLPTSFVKRQVSGKQLLHNLTQPLAVQVGGSAGDAWLVQEIRRMWKGLAGERRPQPHNGLARDVFVADLLAIAHDRLANPFEEREKAMVNVGERLGLREDMDALHREALAVQLQAAENEALELLSGMVLTVIDGDFPRQLLAEHDLTFSPHSLEDEANTRLVYDCLIAKANPTLRTVVLFGGVDEPSPLTPLPKALEDALRKLREEQR